MQNLKHVHSTQDTFLTSKALYEVVPGHQEASSASKRLLIVPSAKLKAYSRRSFSFSAPKLWKSLLEPARHHDVIKTYSLCRFSNKVLK